MQEIFTQNDIKYKDMKKFIVLITVFCMSCGFVNAGQRIQLSQLIGTWALLDDRYEGESTKWKISDQGLRKYVTYQILNKTSISEKEYYLSTGIPDSYDSTLVGKVKSGTHIIYYAGIRKAVRYFEIVSLKNNILTLRYYTEKAIGRDAGYVTKVFRRISSR